MANLKDSKVNVNVEPKKYYVHLIKGNEKSYLNITSYGSVDLLSNFEYSGEKNKFTREEIIAIDPRLVPFMEEVEDDERLDWSRITEEKNDLFRAEQFDGSTKMVERYPIEKMKYTGLKDKFN